MSSDEERDKEFEIESIQEAKVFKEGGRKFWKFRIRWKGYAPEYDTWEPTKHMEGSEEALSHFLGRINTGGRDFKKLALFKKDESFIPLPVGPPKRQKGKGKERPPKKDSQPPDEVIEATPEVEQPSPSKTRKRTSEDTGAEDRLSSKRPRSTLQKFHSKPSLLLTDAGTPSKSKPTDKPISSSPVRRHPSPPIHAALPKPGSMDELLDFSETPERPTALKNGTLGSDIAILSRTKVIKSTMPLHRAREANPLVKLLRDQGRRSPKPHEANRSSTEENPVQGSSPRKRKKPGPGRSSAGLLLPPSTLLTAEKGKLKSVKGKRRIGGRSGRANNEEGDCGLEKSVEDVVSVAMDEDVPVEPPRPDELLHLAGLDSGSADLPEFEEDDVAPTPSNQTAATRTNSNPLSSAVRESLFPTTAPETESHPEWKRPTIFGLLGLGADPSSFGPNVSADESSMPFQINLDSITSLPVLLVDRVSTSTFPVTALSQGGPPGKFYRGSHATGLLGTLRSKASFARVCLIPEATDLYTINFKHFTKRLRDGELFVTMVGQDLLAFCSSSEAFFTQRLNVSSSLLSADAVLAAHVSIENYSAFADATTNADGSTWSQYVATVGAP